MDLLNGRVFNMLVPFFENSQTLAHLTISECNLEDDGCRLLALAIGSSKNKSLTKVTLTDNGISDEGMVNIITSLSMHPHLEKLDLDGNFLQRNGCRALAALLQNSATELEHLILSDNEINDEGIGVLVPALKQCSHLQELRLSHINTVTTRGWQQLASILEAPNSNLEELAIINSRVESEAVSEIARSLTNNRTLISLELDDNPSITDEGWQSLSKLLCNTSSVNSTFLSNHTLQFTIDAADERSIISLLNKRGDKKEVAMIKILQTHNDFDMMPFFEWEFKVLPLMINWLERASELPMIDLDEGPRKLSTIYQFIRAMPVLHVESRLRKELEDIRAAQSQMEKEFRQRQLLMEERKRSIMERLGPL